MTTAIFFQSIQKNVGSFFELIENDWWCHGNRWLFKDTLFSLLRSQPFVIYCFHYLFHHFFTLLLGYALNYFNLVNIVFEIFVFRDYVHLYLYLLSLVFCQYWLQFCSQIVYILSQFLFKFHFFRFVYRGNLFYFLILFLQLIGRNILIICILLFQFVFFLLLILFIFFLSIITIIIISIIK